MSSASVTTLLVYPAHMSSTIDVAHGWEKALGAKGCQYGSALLFYQEALKTWGRLNPDFRWGEGDRCYLASRSCLAGVVEHGPARVVIVDGLQLHRVFTEGLHKLRVPFAYILTESPYLDKEQQEMCGATEPQAVFVNDKASVGKYRNAHYLPQSYDHDVHYPGQEKRDIDVCFVGTLYPERQKLLMDADWRGIRTEFVIPGMNPEGTRLANKDVADLYRKSKIVLNLNRTVRAKGDPSPIGVGESWSIGARAYESAACGALLLAEDGRPELAEVFPNRMPTFRTAQELSSLTRYYLDNSEERQRLASKQTELVKTCSFADRARQIVLPVLEVL